MPLAVGALLLLCGDIVWAPRLVVLGRGRASGNHYCDGLSWQLVHASYHRQSGTWTAFVVWLFRLRLLSVAVEMAMMQRDEAHARVPKPEHSPYTLPALHACQSRRSWACGGGGVGACAGFEAATQEKASSHPLLPYTHTRTGRSNGPRPGPLPDGPLPRPLPSNL